jgi:hypothetical protein
MLIKYIPADRNLVPPNSPGVEVSSMSAVFGLDVESQNLCPSVGVPV